MARLHATVASFGCPTDPWTRPAINPKRAGSAGCLELAPGNASADAVDDDRLITGARLEPVGMRERLRITRFRGWTAGGCADRRPYWRKQSFSPVGRARACPRLIAIAWTASAEPTSCCTARTRFCARSVAGHWRDCRSLRRMGGLACSHIPVTSDQPFDDASGAGRVLRRPFCRCSARLTGAHSVHHHGVVATCRKRRLVLVEHHLARPVHATLVGTDAVPGVGSDIAPLFRTPPHLQPHQGDSPYLPRRQL